MRPGNFTIFRILSRPFSFLLVASCASAPPTPSTPPTRELTRSGTAFDACLARIDREGGNIVVSFNQSSSNVSEFGLLITLRGSETCVVPMIRCSHLITGDSVECDGARVCAHFGSRSLQIYRNRIMVYDQPIRAAGLRIENGFLGCESDARGSDGGIL